MLSGLNGRRRGIEGQGFVTFVYNPLSFLNRNSERVLPGTDFLASAEKDFDVYRTELQITSRINRYLNDDAFRNIALGQNYFRLLGLNYVAPQVCGRPRP